MNGLDVLILAAAFGAGVAGYRLGFVARATSWLGMVIGIAIAARLVEPVIDSIEGAGPGRLFLAAAGLLLGGAFLGQAVGLLVGARLHYALPEGKSRQVDRTAGVAAGLLGVAVAVWLLTPAMSRVPGSTARLARNSVVTRTLADWLPSPPDALRNLERLVGADLPSVLGDLEPAPDLGPPPPESGLTQEVADTVALSTVKVEAAACGRLQDGSGAVLGPDLVVTNAHVVAGADPDDVVVERHPDRAIVSAEVVAFDPEADIAVLRVPGLDRAALPLGDAVSGSVGAVFGHPGGGALERSPYQVGEEIRATGRDIYGGGDVERQVFLLAAELRPGDSGGPMVDPTGAAVGMAFAIAPDRPNVAYALTIEEIQEVLNRALVPTSAGPCLG